MNEFLFRNVVMADRKIGSPLYFTFSVDPGHLETDWVGALYVKATSEKEASIRMIEFLEIHADRWELDDEFTTSDHPWSLDDMVMRERGDMERLERGEVVPGFGW